MIRRRLMLAIGAALLVGGWQAKAYYFDARQRGEKTIETFAQFHYSGDDEAEREAYRSEQQDWFESLRPSRMIYAAGVAGMVVGAGLIGFTVLRPTTRNDE